jgi:hypothetical protein
MYDKSIDTLMSNLKGKGFVTKYFPAKTKYDNDMISVYFWKTYKTSSILGVPCKEPQYKQAALIVFMDGNWKVYSGNGYTGPPAVAINLFSDECSDVVIRYIESQTPDESGFLYEPISKFPDFPPPDPIPFTWPFPTPPLMSSEEFEKEILNL